MKSTLFTFLSLFLFFYCSSQNGKPAKELFQATLAKAKTENKNVFIIFSATWCGPCKLLKNVIHDEYNIQYFEEHYIILELYDHEIGDNKLLENYGTDSILAEYKGDTTAVPYWLILNSSGKKLYGELGMSNYPVDVKRFIKVLKETSKLKDGELKMIYNRFMQVSRITAYQ